MNAPTFHKVLIDWIGDDGEPVVIDTDDSDVVNNHPAFAYTMTYTPDPYDPYKVHVKTDVKFVDCCSTTNPDCVGTDDYEKEYKYWITGPIYAPTNGGWESSDKPDSVWHPNPDFPTSGNPYISYSTVQEIVE